MIFVTVGSAEPFDRLLRALPTLPTGERLLVQTGASSVRPAGAICVPFMTFDEIEAAMKSARVVVSHAGVGSVLTALRYRKQPLLLPRRKCYGEAVDDHQVDLAHRLAEVGLATLIGEPSQLESALAAEREASYSVAPPEEPCGLAGDLARYIDSVLAMSS